MAGGRPDRRGGIRRLLELNREGALEADLIDRGLRLRDCGTPEFTWSDLRAVVRWLPPTANIHRVRDPEVARWASIEAQLLAELVDAAHVEWWAKTRDGHKNRNRPKPIKRPGVAEPQKTTPGGKQQMAMPLVDFLRRSRTARRGTATAVPLNGKTD